jgi:hypothetical protein
MEDKEITLEYIDSIVKPKRELLIKRYKIKDINSTENINYLKKALTNEILGKYIKYRKSYMKVTSIPQKSTLRNSIDLCGLKICYPDDAEEIYDYQILPNGTIMVDYFDLERLEIISEEKFQSEYNKIMNSISRQLEFENTNETNNEETIDKAKSLFNSIENVSNKVSDELNAIHNEFGKAMCKYCKEHYLNQFVAFFNEDNKPSSYMHVRIVHEPNSNGGVELEGDSIFINDDTSVPEEFEKDFYEIIGTDNYRSIKTISELEFNKAYKIAIKRH